MAAPVNKSPRRASLPVWWIASLIFHALLFGWLIFFSPVRVIDLTAKPASPAANVSPARVAQVMEQVREQQAETLAGEVRALEEARRELAQLEASKRDELRLASTNVPADAINKVSAAQENAAKAQAVASAALKNANEQSPSDPPEFITFAGFELGQLSADFFECANFARVRFYILRRFLHGVFGLSGSQHGGNHIIAGDAGFCEQVQCLFMLTQTRCNPGATVLLGGRQIVARASLVITCVGTTHGA